MDRGLEDHDTCTGVLRRRPPNLHPQTTLQTICTIDGRRSVMWRDVSVFGREGLTLGPIRLPSPATTPRSIPPPSPLLNELKPNEHIHTITMPNSMPVSVLSSPVQCPIVLRAVTEESASSRSHHRWIDKWYIRSCNNNFISLR
eukprot:scaffold4186_cov103-Alexandrium_tamarense.AAC.2